MMETLESKTVVTRKPHDCWGCGRTMPAGTHMGYNTHVDGGVFYRSYWCAVCEEIVRDQCIYDDIDQCDLRDGDPEAWEEYRKRIEGGAS